MKKLAIDVPVADESPAGVRVLPAACGAAVASSTCVLVSEPTRCTPTSLCLLLLAGPYWNRVLWQAKQTFTERLC